MGVSAIKHETEERLELYALGRLPEDSVAAVEDHLLLCGECCEALDGIERFAVAMRDGGQQVAPADTKVGLFGRLADLFRLPIAVWVGALATAVLILGVYLSSPRHKAPLVATIQLSALRGGAASVGAAQRTEITLTDAPASAQLRTEVVDGGGSAVWNSDVRSGGDGSASLRIAHELAPGTYFVRLLDGSGKLLHEYAFRVTPAQ